jgi:23S rRNA (cytosine1962-C5)-methyltransferase
MEILGASSAVARNDLSVREKEGLPREVRVLAGTPPDLVWVHDDGPAGRIEFPVDPREGQKTGAFLDQRESRWRVAELARGSVLAARRAAETLAVDTSLPALGLLERAAQRSALANVRVLQKNVFAYLKDAGAEGRRFDVVIVDPPAFAKNRSEIPAALRGYREINRRAMSLLGEGVILVTCSCSYNLGAEDFEDVLREAAADARAEFRVLERRGQASDHPVLLCHPESAYLKCFVLERV